MLCCETGWKIKDIGELTYVQLITYFKCMDKRFEMMNGTDNKRGITSGISGTKRTISNRLV